MRKKVTDDIAEFGLMFGFEKMGLIESPIKGGSGNTEFLIYFKNTGKGYVENDI